MAKSRIIVVEGQTYLVPRKKYKIARKNFKNPDDTWAYIMGNIEDFGRPLEEEETEEEEEEPKKGPRRKKSGRD